MRTKGLRRSTNIEDRRQDAENNVLYDYGNGQTIQPAGHVEAPSTTGTDVAPRTPTFYQGDRVDQAFGRISRYDREMAAAAKRNK